MKEVNQAHSSSATSSRTSHLDRYIVRIPPGVASSGDQDSTDRGGLDRASGNSRRTGCGPHTDLLNTGVRRVASEGSLVLFVAVTTAARWVVQLAGMEILAQEPSAWIRAAHFELLIEHPYLPKGEVYMTRMARRVRCGLLLASSRRRYRACPSAAVPSHGACGGTSHGHCRG
jgi:hypothetical protein